MFRFIIISIFFIFSHFIAFAQPPRGDLFPIDETRLIDYDEPCVLFEDLDLDAPYPVINIRWVFLRSGAFEVNEVEKEESEPGSEVLDQSQGCHYPLPIGF